jgi:uncharacterized membrane protein YeaQ/YmgE (transglycosylase-associated protein family)
MGLLSWIVIGMIGGWLAGLIIKGSGRGFGGDILLGIIGALVGGFIAGAIFEIPQPLSGFNFTTIVMAFLGTMIIVTLIRALSSRPLI